MFRAFDVKNKKMIYYGVFGFLQHPENILKPAFTQQIVNPFYGIESGEMVTENELEAWNLM